MRTHCVPWSTEDDTAHMLGEVLWLVSHYGPNGLAPMFPELSDDLLGELASWVQQVQAGLGGRTNTLALSGLLQSGAWVLERVRREGSPWMPSD